MMFDDMALEASEFDADAIAVVGLLSESAAWDCDPDAHVFVEPYDIDLDDEDDEGDWQVIALDRFGDRMVNPNYI